MELEKLSPGRLAEFERELGMSGEETTAEDVRNIRNWINLQPHLPNLPDDEGTKSWLRNYFLQCKNRPERAKQSLESYFSCRSLVPELFGDPSEPRIVANVRALYLFPVPKLTPDGCRVHVFCHAVPDASAYDATDFMRRSIMYLDWKIRDDITRGDIFIFHMKHSTLSHLSKYNFLVFSRFVATIMNAYPLIIKAVHFTLAPSYISYFISNPFISDKIRKRIKIHSGTNVSSIPAECLPEELGGTLRRSFEDLNEEHHERLIAMREWLLTRQSMKSDEGKRPPEMKDRSELFGSDGTFRALNID